MRVGSKRLRSRTSPRFWSVLIILIFISGIVFIFAAGSDSFRSRVRGLTVTRSPSAQTTDTQSAGAGSTVAAPAPAATRSAPPGETTTPEDPATPPPSQTMSASPTRTAFPTPGPGLETPFGPGGGFLIYLVRPGESFSSIAQAFGTSEAALRRSNGLLPTDLLQAERLIVVPIGQTDLEALPSFRIVYLTQKRSLAELAEDLAVDPEQIRLYNQLGTHQEIPVGRWLIVPVGALVE